MFPELGPKFGVGFEMIVLPGARLHGTFHAICPPSHLVGQLLCMLANKMPYQAYPSSIQYKGTVESLHENRNAHKGPRAKEAQY